MEIHGEEVVGEVDLVTMIHHLPTAATHPQSLRQVYQGLNNKGGDPASGVERWEVRQQVIWPVTVGKLSDLEIINRLGACGEPITMEKGAPAGEVAEEHVHRDRQARHSHRQGTRAPDLALLVGGSSVYINYRSIQ